MKRGRVFDWYSWEEVGWWWRRVINRRRPDPGPSYTRDRSQSMFNQHFSLVVTASALFMFFLPGPARIDLKGVHDAVYSDDSNTFANLCCLSVNYTARAHEMRVIYM